MRVCVCVCVCVCDCNVLACVGVPCVCVNLCVWVFLWIAVVILPQYTRIPLVYTHRPPLTPRYTHTHTPHPHTAATLPELEHACEWRSEIVTAFNRHFVLRVTCRPRTAGSWMMSFGRARQQRIAIEAQVLLVDQYVRLFLSRVHGHNL